MKKKKILIISICLILVLLLTACGGEESFYTDFYGFSTYQETKHVWQLQAKIELQPVMDEIEAAFSYIGEYSDCEEKFGVLCSYCICNNNHPELDYEEHELEFVTGKISGNSGYIWIRYTQKGYNKEGHTVNGSSDILSRIEVEKIDGVWKAVAVREPA